MTYYLMKKKSQKGGKTTRSNWKTKQKKERSAKTQLKLHLESWVKFLSLEPTVTGTMLFGQTRN